MAVILELQNPAGFDDLPTEARFRAWVEAALCRPFDALEQTVRIVDSAESGALNARYRGKQGATNVLSFPADDTLLDYRCLGDLVVCAPLVVEEAAARGVPDEAHWAHLVVHGMLHLQGYDHEDAGDAAIMEALEAKILSTLGYTNPYND